MMMIIEVRISAPFICHGPNPGKAQARPTPLSCDVVWWSKSGSYLPLATNCHWQVFLSATVTHVFHINVITWHSHVYYALVTCLHKCWSKHSDFLFWSKASGEDAKL